MAEAGNFEPVKLICGIIASKQEIYDISQKKLTDLYGELDLKSQFFRFDFTDYYEKQMGGDLQRLFISFSSLISPESLSSIKLRTNLLESEIKEEFGSHRRLVNIDPGYLTASSLIMATTKDFSHRIPLKSGIYAHLEMLFGKRAIQTLDWTYPDFREMDYHPFFLEVRKIYLKQLA